MARLRFPEAQTSRYSHFGREQLWACEQSGHGDVLRRSGRCRIFLSRSHIDQFEAACRSFGERGHSHFEIRVIPRQIVDERASGRGTLGTPACFEFGTGKIHKIEEQEFAAELPLHGQ